ncbi:MAG: glutamine-hydrolyzing GMP synthase [Gammaproteobacteria bacterium]|nr:glutamine-hydrolyzing GMP synthase [Gammaproteobacteria bacterium]
MTEAERSPPSAVGAATDRVVVLDFGSQYTQLIARRVRECGVYCEIVPFDVDEAMLTALGANAFILSGGPESVTVGATPRVPDAVLEGGVPVLGICYGMQAMAAQRGGAVVPSTEREFGHARVRIREGIDLFAGLDPELDVWMSHGDRVTDVPPGFVVAAASDNAPVAAMADVGRRWYGLQFHPEVTHTQSGSDILRRFVRDIAGCEATWTPSSIVDRAVASVRRQVGDGKVLLGLSGGVDSSVVAALVSRAIGDGLTCVFVDNGLLRKGEVDEVQAAFGPSNALPLNLVTVDAAAEFLQALAGVDDPEQKRRVIGRTFVEVFEREAERIADVEWLAQGTIYPDVIESAAARTGKAHVIKSHHNVGGLPERMKLGLVEPLRDLFKDEVRKVGLALGLPESLVFRHPFPGPGLGVRVLGEVRREYLSVLREADAIFIEELRRADWYDRVAQAFAVYLPVKSVGVVGDARRHEHVIALRAVVTTDFMTANWAELPHDLIATVSNRIVNELPGVSRVVYDVTGKPPGTIEWE